MKESAQDIAPHKHFLVVHGRRISFKAEHHDWNLSQNGKCRCEAVENKALVDELRVRQVFDVSLHPPERINKEAVVDKPLEACHDEDCSGNLSIETGDRENCG